MGNKMQELICITTIMQKLLFITKKEKEKRECLFGL